MLLRLLFRPLFFLSDPSGAYAAEGGVKLPPLADLESQFSKYFAKLDRDIEDLSVGGEFEDAAGNLKRDVNILILLAMAIGQSEETGEFSSAAASIIRDGKAVLAASDPDSAAKAAAVFKASAAGTESTGEVTWEKAAQLQPLMVKAVPSLATEIKRLSRNEKTFSRSGNPEKVAGDAAVLAVIAYGCRFNVDETAAPSEEALWKEYCARLAESSLKLNEAANALRSGTGDFSTFSESLKEVEATCSDTCHGTFGSAE